MKNISEEGEATRLELGTSDCAIVFTPTGQEFVAFGGDEDRAMLSHEIGAAAIYVAMTKQPEIFQKIADDFIEDHDKMMAEPDNEE